MGDALAEATGKLESDNTFVSEYLLRYAAQLGDSQEYQVEMMGGLTVGREEPAYSACGCSSASDFTQSYVAPLQQCSDPDSGDRSYVVSGAFGRFNTTNCSSLVETVAVPVGRGVGVTSIPSSSGNGLPDTAITTVTTLAPLNASVRVDGFSLGALQGLSCSAIDSSSLGDGDTSGSVEEGCGENSTAERPASAFHPDQTQRTSVTVWYSGKVLHIM